MKSVFAFFQQRYQWKLPFPDDPNSLLQILVEQGIDRAFTLVYAHKPGISRQINRWLADFCAANPWLVPFGSAHPRDPDLSAVVRECLDYHHFPGLKLHCLVQQCRPDEPMLDPLYEAVVERSKGIIVHASSFPQPVREHLGVEYVARLLKRFPGLNLVIPHLGLNDLQHYPFLLEKYEGLFLDTAFVFQNQGFIPPLDGVAEIITAYPDRVIYGSDFPLILEPPQKGIERILDLGLPQDIYDRIFYKNAANFLSRITN